MGDNDKSLVAEVAAAALGVELTARGAQAQILGPLGVVDSGGTLIDVLLDSNTVACKFSDGLWRTLEIDEKSLLRTAEFYYTSNNCTGPRYIYFDSFERPAISEAFYENVRSPGSAGKADLGG